MNSAARRSATKICVSWDPVAPWGDAADRPKNWYFQISFLNAIPIFWMICNPALPSLRDDEGMDGSHNQLLAGILKLFYLLDCQSVLAFSASSISKDTLGVHSVHTSIVKGHMNKVSHMWIFAFTPQLMRCGGPKGTAKCSCRGRGRNVGSTAAPKVVFAPSVRPPVLLVEKTSRSNR